MRSVADLASRERIAPDDARTFVQTLADALATWEAAADPNDEPHARVSPSCGDAGENGAGMLRASSSSEDALLWTPPSQARGAPWNAAANRYALGLVLYRAIAGVHPAHAERRVRLDASWSPPPFPEDVAQTLPLGVQSTVLALLDPDESARPSSAAAIRACVSDKWANALLNKSPTKAAPVR